MESCRTQNLTRKPTAPPQLSGCQARFTAAISKNGRHSEESATRDPSCPVTSRPAADSHSTVAGVPHSSFVGCGLYLQPTLNKGAVFDLLSAVSTPSKPAPPSP